MAIKKQPTVLFFDSGMGGLSVYKEAKKLSPDCHYLYCFDNAGFPYSEKSEEEIIARTLNVCQSINEKFPLDAIVIACNTASTVVLSPLRERFSVPVVGTVPAIKPAAQRSQTKHIGLLATKGTVKREYVNNLIERFAPHCKVEKLGSTILVEIAEQKIQGQSVDLIALSNELKPWKNMADLDTICLGCTHFPLIKDEIQICLPQVKNFMDPGYAIAKRLKHLLEDAEINSEKRLPQVNQVFSTKELENPEKLKSALLLWGFKELNLLNE